MEKADARARLDAAVARIFADGVMEPAERDELRKLFSGGGLTVPEVREVFAAFVERTWGEVIADGVVTPAERGKLEAIVRELKLPESMVPEAVRKILSEPS